MSLIHEHETLVEDERDILKGLAAGAIGGLVASWVMDEFQGVWSRVSEAMQSPPGSSSNESAKLVAKESEGDEPATVKAAEAISQNLLGHKLQDNEKKSAGDVIHYAVGSMSGAIYGAAAELAPEVTTGIGISFGTAVWLVVDEAAVPLLGLSKGPAEYPLSTHIYALASHFVFGLTTEVVRRGLRGTILR